MPPTDCQLIAPLPALTAGLAATSSTSETFAVPLPAFNGHFAIGMPTSPPLLLGTATTRDLLGTATVG